MVNPRPSRKYIILEPLVLALIMVIGISIGYKINDTEDDFSLIQRLDESAVPIGRVEEILRFVENKYVDSVDTDKIENQLIETVLHDLDPHSIYIPPTDLEDVNLQMSGKFRGIGIETMLIKDTFYVSYVMENSPAADAGLPIGAKIISVNDTIVSGKHLDYSELSSQVSSSDAVQLLVKYGTKEKSYTLLTTEFKVNSAQNHFLINPNTGFIKLERFTSKSYSDFLRALESLVDDQKLDNLIIDLRNNPGGYLPETSKILSQLFKEKDRLLLYTEGDKSEKQEYKTTGKCFFDVGNIAVLINEGSASGSEILAGAIQDWDRGVIIGTRSFGKGLVQEQYELNNGGAIRLTVAKYYTPTGRLIQKEYKNSDDYRNEIDDRRINGDHFNDAESSDSIAYRTMKLKRMVKGGGGIQPDIYVTIDKNEISRSYYDIFLKLEEHLFLENLRSKILLEDSSVQIDEILEDLKPLLINDGFAEAELSKYAYLLQEDIEILLTKWNVSKIASKKVDISNDEEVQEALKVFDNKTLLSEFVY